jgi:hypothetical protein
MGSNQTNKINVKNDLNNSQRELRVYHHFAGHQHTLKHNEEQTFALQSTLASNDVDYLLVSIDYSTGNLPQCWVELGMGKAALEFIPTGQIDVKVSIPSEKVAILEIPKDEIWKLKIALPKQPGSGGWEGQNVNIGDDKPGIED